MVKTAWMIDPQSTFKDTKVMVVVHGEFKDLEKVTEQID